MTNELANVFNDEPMDFFDDDFNDDWTPMDDFFSNDFFGDLGRSFFRAMPKINPMRTNVSENKHGYSVSAELPGFKKSQIHLDYRNGNLTINAVHNATNRVKNHNGRVIRKEMAANNVARSFYLPNVKFNGIRASYDGGVLNVSLPKKASKVDDAHRISIK